MTKMEIIDQIAGDLRGYLIDFHQKSEKNFLGILHPVVPQELFYAAGLHPFRIFPFPGESITKARAHLHVDTSSIFRAIWDQILKDRYLFMDGIVIPESCETVTYFSRGWMYHRPNDFVATTAGVRFSKTQNALHFFANELQTLAKNVENYFGTHITHDSLENAINVYNRNRELIRNLYGLRKRKLPLLSGLDVMKITMVSHIMDKEENNRLLEILIHEINTIKAEPSKPVARLMVSGPCISDFRLMEALEASGALVVVDDTNLGSRSFFHNVDDDQNQFMALARAYSGIPCPFSTSAKNRLAHIIKMAAEYEVDGVVFVIERACESEKMDFPYLEKEIKRRINLPVTFIETEYLCEMAPIRTRIDAFVESLI